MKGTKGAMPGGNVLIGHMAAMGGRQTRSWPGGGYKAGSANIAGAGNVALGVGHTRGMQERRTSGGLLKRPGPAKGG